MSTKQRTSNPEADMLTPEDLMSETVYKRTAKMATLRYTDSRETIVAWPLSIAPTDHAAACGEALVIVRNAYGAAK